MRNQSKQILEPRVTNVLERIFDETETNETERKCEAKWNQHYEQVLENRENLLSNAQIKTICGQIARQNKKRPITGESYPKLLNQHDDCRMRLLLAPEAKPGKKRPQKAKTSRQDDAIVKTEDARSSEVVASKAKESRRDAQQTGARESKRKGVRVDISTKRSQSRRRAKEQRKSRKKAKAKAKGKKSKFANVESKIKHLIQHDRKLPKLEQKKMKTRILIESES